MEKILSKYFWVINVVTLMAIAFFLADGVGELAAAKISSVLPQTDDRTTKAPARPTTRHIWTAPDGSAIVDRNIFDSTIETLDSPLDMDGDTEDTAEEKGDIPLVPCTGDKVKLLATVASRRDEDWSFASISEGQETKLCRVGDEVDGRKVSGITWRYIFLRGASDECFIDIFGDHKNMQLTVKKPASEVASSTRQGAMSPGGDEELKNGIQTISETEKVVERAIVDKLLADPTQFIRSVRVRPHRENGKVVGFALRRFRPNSPLALLGAQRGDIIHSVNGAQLTSIDQALGAYQKLRTSDDLTFSITRNGKPMDISVRIR